MIEKDGNDREIVCEARRCTASHGPFPSSEFRDQLDEAKRQGWLVVAKAGGYSHYCPEHRDPLRRG